MVEFSNVLNFLATLTEVINWMVISAMVGLVVYGFWKLILDEKKEWEAPARPDPNTSLDATGWVLVVDGSNFAHRNLRNQLEVKLEHLEEVLRALERRFQNARFIVFCDANLRYKIGRHEKEQFDRYVAEKSWTEYDFRETHGQAADGVILQYARKNARCIVVSNDRFRNDEEVTLRQGVPLLKMHWRAAPVYPYSSVLVHGETNCGTIPVGRLIKNGKA